MTRNQSQNASNNCGDCGRTKERRLAASDLPGHVTTAVRERAVRCGVVCTEARRVAPKSCCFTYIVANLYRSQCRVWKPNCWNISGLDKTLAQPYTVFLLKMDSVFKVQALEIIEIIEQTESMFLEIVSFVCVQSECL